MNIFEMINEKILGVDVWKWLTLIAFLAASVFIRKFLGAVYRKIKNSLPSSNNHKNFWSFWRELKTDKAAIEILWSLLGIFIIHALSFPVSFERYLITALEVWLSFYIIRLVYISIDAFGLLMKSWASKTETNLDDQLAPFATKTLKILAIVLGTLITLQNFGFNVISLLAGLGLGGLALALAAQDTAANLFGSVTILADNPFKIGDHIKIGDSEGIVEEIGFRSTRIRTFYNSSVTIPNSTVAKEKIDNMGDRPHRRIRQVLGIHYDTPVEKILQFCEGIRYLILQEKKTQPESVVVRFINYNTSTLDILVNFHLAVADINEELKTQENIFCDILKLAKKMGVEFAYPTQTVYLQKNSAPTNLAGS
ncbi:MAG: mechanosensitive ion channel domain-containing protein [Bdellovibrionota bacterium]